MRHLIGSVVLACLVLVLFRVGPPALTRVKLARADASAEKSGGDAAPSLARAKAVVRPPAQPALRVLFIGNSHTYVNDMPRSIVQLAAAAGETHRLEVALAVAGGATLADHLANQPLRERLGSEHWDYVVLQEQQQRPTWRQPYLERDFFAPARTFDVLIRAASSRTVLFMTPARLDGDRPGVPNDTYERMQERSRSSHLQLGRELDAIVAPVGEAWAWAHRESPEQPLWAADRYHPSPQGSYLTACVLFSVLYARSVLDNRFTAGLPAGDAAFLQRAADVAVSGSRSGAR